jgi:hypothetical protein
MEAVGWSGMRTSSGRPTKAPASRAARKSRQRSRGPSAPPPIPNALRKELLAILDEAARRREEIKIEVPAKLVEVAKVYTARHAADMKQKGHRRALFEAYVWILWMQIGIRQMRAAAAGAEGWVSVHRKYRARLFTAAKYKSRFDALTRERVQGQPILEKQRGYKVGEHAQRYRLAEGLLPSGPDQGTRTVVTIRELLAQEKITGWLQERADKVQERVERESTPP